MIVDWNAVGSSPLTRGARRSDHAEATSNRLIPAHAGSTPARERCQGGKYGSSPLTRGAPTPPQPACNITRLIPAHAGSTCIRIRGKLTDAAHPRSRGEHSRERRRPTTRDGSSPLTRGAQDRTVVTWGENRLIPAHAGSTR